MKQIIFKLKRLTALALAIMLMTSSDLSLFGSVFAAETKTENLYTMLADEYFINDEKAYAILTSNALNGDVDNISVTNPDETDNLISIVNGEIIAKNFPAEYSSDLTLSWEPISYTVGTVSRDIVENSADFLGSDGNGEATVDYRLVLTDVDENLLQLPAQLMREAQGQMAVLKKLVADDAPYLGYMYRLDKGTLQLIRVALRTGDEFGDLNEDPDKSDALYNSFFDIISSIRSNCYNSSMELKIYRLLVNYKEQGLLYYYTNNGEFQAELDLFSGYLNALLGEETWDPDADVSGDEVVLTEADKTNALNKIVEWATTNNYLSAGTELDFAELQEKLNAVREELSAPNEAINLESDALETLVKVLETGLAAGEAISSYDEQPTLRTTVSATYCTVSFDANGGSGSMDSLFVSPGAVASLPVNEFEPAAGKKFKCWRVDGTEHAVGSSITVKADTVVTAVWDGVYYTVSFAAGEGTGTMESKSVVHGGALTLPGNGFTAPVGKQFKCWSINGIEYAENATVTVTGNTVVTAVWEPLRCTVSFEAGGGTGTMANLYVVYGTEAALPANGFTAPAGMQFRCWIVNGIERMPGYQFTLTEDTVVTAVWKPVADEVVAVNTIVVENSDGTAVTDIPDGKMDVSVSVTNLSSDGTAVVIVAAYTEQGRMVDIKCVPISGLSVGGSVEISASFDNSKGIIHQLRVFVVGALSKPAPLGGVISFPAQ